MGCDIHCFAEVKIGGSWHFYGQVKLDRSYELFAKMADVRNDLPGREYQEPIAPRRGIPADATFMTRFFLKETDSDAHSISWMSSKEVEELGLWAGEWVLSEERSGYGAGYLFGSSWETFYKYKSSYPEDLQDFRWIFWFDN